MKKLMIIGISIMLLINFSGCGRKNAEGLSPYKDSDTQNEGNIQVENAGIDTNLETEQIEKETEQIEKETDLIGVGEKDDIGNVSWSSTYSIPVPKPDTEYIAPNDFGTFCYGIDAKQLKDYLINLETDGWICIDDTIFAQTIHYVYTKGDMIFQIIDHTETVLNSDITESYIFVFFSYGYEKINKRENTLSKSDAAGMIEELNKQLDDTDSEVKVVGGAKIAMIIELFMEDSFEKMGLQAFTVINAEGRLIGNYLICNQSVLYVVDPLTNVCIVDIEEDGEYELLSLYGWGSGIYRYELSAYKYENPIYFSSLTKILHCAYRNCFVPENGYGKLSLKKINDAEVRLLDHDWLAEESEDYNGEPEDYGKILLDADRYHLVPEKLEQFPYQQWDYNYDQANLSSISESTALGENEKSLEEPPLINITVGETKLYYEVSKTLWNGEDTSERISFAALMKDNKELPLFDSPKKLLEFEDTILLDFGDTVPDSIVVKDYLLSETGGTMYTDREIIERFVKIEGEGKFSLGLYQHFALMLSSNSETYKNPSYRGFRVICTFGDDKVCEYAFVLMLGPTW